MVQSLGECHYQVPTAHQGPVESFFKTPSVRFLCKDRKVLAPHPVSEVERCILDHFSISDRFGLLPHLYVNWDKAFFAGLCKRICQVARETGDPLCKYLMEDAGR